MSGTITTKGTARLSLKPDLTMITLSLRSSDKKYDKAMQKAGEQLEILISALTGIGFDETDLKTTNFNVNTEYESVPDEKGRYRQVFKGYCCYQNMKLEFGFDPHFLSDVLSAVAGSVAEPQLNVQFSVKDKDSVGKELLKNAAKTAREKAEVLAEASGAKLGKIVSINYNVSEYDLRSPTVFAMEDRCMKMAGAAESINMTPDDITVSDSVTFVWELE